MYSHHGQVVALLGIAHELMDSIGHTGYQLVGILLLIGQGTDSHVVDTFHLELIVFAIHRLGESIGEEQDGGACEDACLLKGIFPRRHETYRDIGVARQLTHTCSDEQWGVVTCITVVQTACRKVEHAHEESHKHVGLVHVGNGLVHRCHDAVGHGLVSRHGAEGRTGDSHEERSWHTLTRHVANTEEELLIAEIEVEEVATHLLGRRQRGIEHHVVAVVLGGEFLREHAHLYITGNAQVALYRSLLGSGILQLFNISHQRLLHVAERVAQLAYLVNALEVGQRSIKLS